ncbi:MAG: GGDEF domain-containing protein [Lachnospiraceae bacterium]|nr:GGDEF domain-containing protein [Lachnospiraceae bacterium]
MNNGIKKKNYRVYIIECIAICIFLIYIFCFDKATNTRQPQSVYTVTKWNNYTESSHMKKTVVSGTIPEIELSGNVLAFYSVHQNIKVYTDNTLIYEYPVANNNPLSDSPGYCWNFITLPHNTNKLEIIFTSPYSSYLKNIPTFYIGNAYSLPAFIITRNIIPFTLCIIMFVLGIVLVAYHLFVSIEINTSGKLLKLGIFSIFLSIWSINECSITTLILKNSLITSYLAFLSLMLLPFPFAMFVQTFYEDDNKIWNWFCKVDLVQIVSCVVLQFIGIIDLRETLWVTIAMVCLLVGIIIKQSYSLIRNGIHSRVVKIHMICIFICVLSLLMDISGYCSGSWDANTFGRLGFLTYVIILGLSSVRESTILMKMGQEANAYQTLAYTDQMTGLYNRTCFNKDFANFSENPTDIAVIDFDLNNLKYTNDTFGHSIGDLYIKSCAQIIYEIFNGIGTCYRVGGDEFVALIEKASTIDMTHYLAMLESSVDASNRENKSTKVKMQIAYGYAIYSPGVDKNLEDTYNRADKFMYTNKKEKKERLKFER